MTTSIKAAMLISLSHHCPYIEYQNFYRHYWKRWYLITPLLRLEAYLEKYFAYSLITLRVKDVKDISLPDPISRDFDDLISLFTLKFWFVLRKYIKRSSYLNTKNFAACCIFNFAFAIWISRYSLSCLILRAEQWESKIIMLEKKTPSYLRHTIARETQKQLVKLCTKGHIVTLPFQNESESFNLYQVSQCRVL